MTITVLLFPAGLVCISAIALVTVWCIRIRRQVQSLRGEVDGLTRRLEQMESLEKGAGRRQENRLTGRQLAERFESMEYGRFSISPKYRHVAQLARSGLGVADIAEILEVSQNQAEQMLELAGSRRKTA